MPEKKQILGIGHCSFDSARIERVVMELGGCFQNVSSLDQALPILLQTDIALVMVNRVIGGNETGGLEIIQAIVADQALSIIPVMLVSAYPDKQREAENAGAVPGFGKDVLETQDGRNRLAKYLE